MLDLATLFRPFAFMDQQANNWAEYEQNRQSMLPDFDIMSFNDRLWSGSPYSLALTDLIALCLSADIAQRPYSQELRQQTRLGLKNCLGIGSDKAKLSNGEPDESGISPEVRNSKLYYRKNDINDIKNDSATCDFQLDVEDFLNLFKPGRNDPDDPDLQVQRNRLWASPHDSHRNNEIETVLELRRYLSEKDARIEPGNTAQEWLRFRRNVGHRGGQYFFKDSMIDEMYNTSEDDTDVDCDHRPGSEDEDIITYKRGILDLSSKPKRPVSAYDMFVKLRQNQAGEDLSVYDLQLEWDELSPEHKAVFEALYKRAKRFYQRHKEAWRDRPQKPDYPQVKTGKDFWYDKQLPASVGPNSGPLAEKLWNEMTAAERQNFARDAGSHAMIVRRDIDEQHNANMEAWRQQYRGKPKREQRTPAQQSAENFNIRSARAIWKEAQRANQPDSSESESDLNDRWALMEDGTKTEWCRKWVQEHTDVAVKLEEEYNLLR